MGRVLPGHSHTRDRAVLTRKFFHSGLAESLILKEKALLGHPMSPNHRPVFGLPKDTACRHPSQLALSSVAPASLISWTQH